MNEVLERAGATYGDPRIVHSHITHCGFGLFAAES